jgi:hypothetical protein
MGKIVKLVADNEERNCQHFIEDPKLEKQCIVCPSLDECLIQYVNMNLERLIAKGDSDVSGKGLSKMIPKLEGILVTAKDLLKILETRPEIS